jgi:hypothetical protein
VLTGGTTAVELADLDAKVPARDPLHNAHGGEGLQCRLFFNITKLNKKRRAGARTIRTLPRNISERKEARTNAPAPPAPRLCRQMECAKHVALT